MKATHNMIVVEEIDEDSPGVVATDKERAQPQAYKARIISVGPHYPHDVKPGDVVYVREKEGIRMYDLILGKEYFAIREQWVLGVCDESC